MDNRVLVSFLLHKLGQPRYNGDVYSLPSEWLRHFIGLATARSCVFVCWDQVLSGLPDKPGVHVALTFDDGFESDVTEVLPLLKEKSVSGTFFVVPGFIGLPGYLSWAQVRTLASEGMTIGSHTLNHLWLPQLSAQCLSNELVLSREIIEDQIGAPVKMLAVPGGFYNRRILEQAGEAGYVAVATSRFGVHRLDSINRMKSSPLVFKRNSMTLRTSRTAVGQLLEAHSPWQLVALDRAKFVMQRAIGISRYRQLAAFGRAIPWR